MPYKVDITFYFSFSAFADDAASLFDYCHISHYCHIYLRHWYFRRLLMMPLFLEAIWRYDIIIDAAIALMPLPLLTLLADADYFSIFRHFRYFLSFFADFRRCAAVHLPLFIILLLYGCWCRRFRHLMPLMPIDAIFFVDISLWLRRHFHWHLLLLIIYAIYALFSMPRWCLLPLFSFIFSLFRLYYFIIARLFSAIISLFIHIIDDYFISFDYLYWYWCFLLDISPRLFIDAIRHYFRHYFFHFAIDVFISLWCRCLMPLMLLSRFRWCFRLMPLPCHAAACWYFSFSLRYAFTLMISALCRCWYYLCLLMIIWYWWLISDAFTPPDISSPPHYYFISFSDIDAADIISSIFWLLYWYWLLRHYWLFIIIIDIILIFFLSLIFSLPARRLLIWFRCHFLYEYYIVNATLFFFWLIVYYLHYAAISLIDYVFATNDVSVLHVIITTPYHLAFRHLFLRLMFSLFRYAD